MEMEGGIVREIRGDSEEWQRRKIGKGVTETDRGEREREDCSVGEAEERRGNEDRKKRRPKKGGR